MAEDRKTYRWVRMLTGGVTPFALAAALLVFARFHAPAWVPGAQEAGICRELLAGTTVGRQALFGSCWVAPLPVLFYLPFAWLFPEPLAGMGAFFTAWFLVLWAVREAVKATGQSGVRIVLAQAAVAGMMMLSPQAQTLGIRTALMTLFLLLGGAALADWAAYRRLRDVVTAGGAGAFLALCGLPAFVSAGVAVGMLPLAACGQRESRGRMQAWLLLGGLPLVYAVGVWVLMNRLVLGDPLFFVRSLSHLLPRPGVFVLAVLGSGLALLPALIVTWVCDARTPAAPGAGPAAASAVLISFAVELLACGWVLTRFGVGWHAGTLHVAALAVLAVALARLRQPPVRLAASLALFVYLSRFWLGGAPLSAAGAEGSGDADVPRQVEAFVESRTPYGRVFVLGYAGLDLLRGYAGGRLQPNLDLHVGALRRAYPGQNLYVLVPRPTGAARSESVFWKYPDLYALGGDRLLYAATFGSWRLFEVVTAPTREQWDEWRRAAETGL